MSDGYDYAPVGIYDDEDELLRRSGYAGVPPPANVPPPSTSAPSSSAPPVSSAAPMPAVGSLDDLESRAVQPHGYAPVASASSPAQTRLKTLTDQGAPPVTPLHGWKRALDAVSQLTWPSQSIEQGLRYGPQREYHNNLSQAQSDVAAENMPQDEEAKRGLSASQAEQYQSRAELEHEQAETLRKTGGQKPGITPEETTIHDLMTGEGGQPRVNPQTGKPYSYLEAYGAVQQAKQDTKPDPAVKDKEKDISDWLSAHHLDDTPTNREAARQGIANRSKDFGAKNDARADRSYQFHASRIDKLANPIEQRAERISRLEDTLNQNSPQADTLVAPELLTVMAGGQGSGLRMNEAEIQRIVGGRDKWESIKSALQQWQLDPTKPFAFQPEQRKEIRDLFSTIRERVNRKMEILDQYRGELTDSDDPKEHRRIVNDLQRELNKVDAGGAEKKDGKTGADASAKKWNPVSGRYE